MIFSRARWATATFCRLLLRSHNFHLESLKFSRQIMPMRQAVTPSDFALMGSSRILWLMTLFHAFKIQLLLASRVRRVANYGCCYLRKLGRRLIEIINQQLLVGVLKL